MISNKLNGKVYTGSSVSVCKRIKQHSMDLVFHRHTNCHLQSAYLLYGPIFEFRFIETCDRDKLSEREDYYIGMYSSRDGNIGYNLQAACRDDSSNRWNKEVKDKISKSNRENFKKNPDRTRKAVARLMAWHKANPGIAGGKCKPRKLFNHKLGLIYEGCLMDLVRKYPDMKLQQSHLDSLVHGKAKKHKGWTTS